MKMDPVRSIIQWRAVREFKRGDPLKEIAARYGVAIPVISHWAKDAGLPRRPQGARKKPGPKPEQLNLIKMALAARASGMTFDAIGRELGYSGRMIFYLCKHWRDYQTRSEAADAAKQQRDFESTLWQRLVISPGVGIFNDLLESAAVSITEAVEAGRVNLKDVFRGGRLTVAGRRYVDAALRRTIDVKGLKSSGKALFDALAAQLDEPTFQFFTAKSR